MSTNEMTQVEQIASLPPELAIMRMENESIQALAAARPLDYELIKKDLDAQLTSFPQLATEAIYNKPLGREDSCGDCGAGPIWPDKRTKRKAEKCFKCGSKNIIEGTMKYARNLSIRAAETLAEAVGFNRVRADASFVDANTVKIEATFTNYRTGRIWQDSTVLRNTFTDKSGAKQTINDDRFLGLTVKAEKSKCIREVIVRSMPAGLKAWFWERCEQLTDEVLDEKTVEKIVGVFSTKGVKVEEIEKLLGRTRAGWTKDDRKTLLGLLNAVKDGETTIAEAFSREEPEPAGKVQKSDLDEKVENGSTATPAEKEKKPAKTKEKAADKKEEQKAAEEQPKRSEVFEHLAALLEDVKTQEAWGGVKKQVIDHYAKRELSDDEAVILQERLAEAAKGLPAAK